MERGRGHETRLWLASGVILCLFGGLFGRLCWIQGTDAQTYRALAEQQHHTRIRLAVPRGSILDREGRELAVSVQAPSVFVNPREVRDKPAAAARLGELLGVDATALLERMERQRRLVCLEPHLAAREEAALSQELLRRRFGGAIEVVDGGLYARPAMVANPRRVAADLAEILGRDAEDLEADLAGHLHFTWVKRHVTEEERKRVLAAPGLRGLGIAHEYRRAYVHGTLAAQVIGFVGIDQGGLEGVELTCDGELAGTAGHATFRRDAAGRYISAVGLPRKAPRPGADVQLTIDAVVQSYAEAALQEAWELWAPEAAMAVVVDPRSGEVLAAAGLPTYDPNRYAAYDPDDLKERTRARCVIDWMEPGSIMKPFVLSGALTEGVVSEDTVVFCENGVWLRGSRRFHDHHAYGNLTAAEVIIKSSNIGAAKIGLKLGAERLYSYLRRFGFGRPTGLRLRGENPGLLRPPPQWSGYSLPSISIGQEICVNVMQMTMAYATIANDGVRVRPRLVRRVLRLDGTWREFPRQEMGRAIPASVARRVRTILFRTVEQGTGKRARLELYSVGGKTGTAQIAVDGTFSHDEVICSFVAMAPAARPRVVVMVSVSRPTKTTGGRHFGGTVAAPVVGRIIQRTLAYLGVEPEKTKALARLGLAAAR